MKTLLIIYHSQTGGTRQMAEAAARGAATESFTTTHLRHAGDTTPEAILGADGYIFATPETLAAIAGPMKTMFDRCYYPVLNRIEGRPYVSLVCAGSDGQNAARQVARIATGWRLKPVAEPLIILTNAQTAAAILAPKIIAAPDLARSETLGATLATGLAAGIF